MYVSEGTELVEKEGEGVFVVSDKGGERGILGCHGREAGLCGGEGGLEL